MKNVLAFILLAAVAIAMVACGGSDAIVPEANTPVGTDADQALITPQAPAQVFGDHSVSNVPGKLNVFSGYEGDGLQAVLDRYGYTVESEDGAWATVSVPVGTEEDAATRLAKEYNIFSAEPVRVVNTPSLRYDYGVVRQSSFTPLDPMYGDQFVNFFFDGTNLGYDLYVGQAAVMGYMGFPGAWDVSLSGDVAPEPVTVAIIDAGWFDYSAVNRQGLNEASLDAANSGFMAADGTFTAGLTAAAWDLIDDGNPDTRNLPYRDAGEILLGMIGAGINDFQVRGFDFDADGVTADDVWNDGIAGMNPNADFILIKTGQVSGDNWTFSDGHIANSIDHAVASGANIIVLGMFGVGAVSGIVQTAVTNARDNDVLVIAPAGDVVYSAEFDEGTGAFLGTFADSPVDITVSPVTPASAVGCLSVTGTGYDRIDEELLGTVDFGDGEFPIPERGWYLNFTPPFDQPFWQVTDYCNTGADIAAVGFGIGFSYHPFFSSGTPAEIIPGESLTTTIDSFGSLFATGYVAGAASMAYQALSFGLGTPPSDEQVEAALLDTVDLAPMDGVANNGGFLNANSALDQALSGNSLFQPGMVFDSVVMSQPLAAVTRGTDLSATAMVLNGTAPFSLEVDWDNGDGPVTVDPWNNGDPVTLAGGYTDSLGLKGINVTVTDADGQDVNIGFAIHVINPLAVSISVSDVTGAGVPLNNLKAAESYRFRANPTNVYTGDIAGSPNTTTYNWYFNGLADPIPSPLPPPDATGPSPVFAYISPASPELTLVVVEDARPDTVARVNLNVN